jgi:hypothetical protein
VYQVAGLAQHVHDSSTLKEKFDTLVSNDKDLPGDKIALDRRVPTRWNSDLTCLMLTYTSEVLLNNSLGLLSISYKLTDFQKSSGILLRR